MAQKPLPPEPIEVVPAPGTVSGLGAIVEATLIRWIQLSLNSAKELISEIIEYALEIFLESAEEALVDVNRPVIDEILRNLPSDSLLIPYFRGLLALESQAGFFSLAGVGAAVGSSATGNLLGILMRPLGYELDSKMYTARLDPSALIAAYWRGLVQRDLVLDQLGDLGWSPGSVDIWEAILKPLLSNQDLTVLYMRQEITEQEMREEIKKRGYDDRSIDLGISAARPLTTIGDLVNLVHRGIADEEEFRKQLARQGYTVEQIDQLAQMLTNLVSPGDIVELYRRGELSRTDTELRLAQHGYPLEAVDDILKVAQPLTAVDNLVDLYHRGEIDQATFVIRVQQYGYTEEQVAELEKLIQRIPGPGDLVTMAVREAFSPAIIAQYQYLSEFPSEFATWMEKQGYSQEWAERYWAAHWSLPSLSMAYEMFHRRIISRSELDNLFVIADIAPYWRSRLTEAAYQPLTRVDVRRMFQMGVLGRQQVYESYLDLGYSPENAELMTQFTEQFEHTEDREGTKTDILQGYQAGALTQEETQAALQEIGYQPEWASYYTALTDLKQMQGLLDDQVALLKTQYVEGTIDRTAVFTELGRWNLPSKQVEIYLAQWDIAKERTITVATQSQLEGFYKEGLISEDQYRIELAKRHYSPDTTTWFIQQTNLEIEARAAAAEDKARTEQLRVQRAVEKSAYDVLKANLDLQIAQLKRAIADSKVLLPQIADEQLRTDTMAQITVFELAVVQLTEEKARGKLALAGDLARLL